MMLPELTPELKMMYLQYDLQRKEFSELLTKKNEMLMYEEQYLTALYLSVVGQLQHQKFCLDVDVKMLVQRIQLMQSYINRNKNPDKQLIEQKIHHQFEAFFKKIAQESEQLIMAKKFLIDSDFLPPHLAQKLKEVYKVLVKKLHPDINPNITDHEKDLLLKVQAAYDMGNLDVLNAILLSLDMDTPAVAYHIDGIKEQWLKIKEHVVKLKSQLADLEAKFPFSFRDKLLDKRWIETQQQSLDADILVLSAEKKKYLEYLKLMDEWKPVVLN